MDRENQIEKFRILWEQIMVGNKLEVCAEELRSLQLLLTDKGKQAICKHHDEERILIENIFSILSEDESNSLINIFEKIVEKL